MIDLQNNMMIDETHLEFSYARSSGPGGQNVNKLNTQVTVFLNLSACGVFTDDQLARIHSKLRTRIDKTGRLRVTCQNSRSQYANRMAAIERMGQLLNWALRKDKPRKKTRIPRGVNEKRLRRKKQRSDIKKTRSARIDY